MSASSHAIARWSTPFGWVTARASDKGLTELRVGGEGPEVRSEHDWLREAQSQLDAYFAGELREFTLPLALNGTPFQRAVWDEVRRVRYGETRSYAHIAVVLGQGAVARSVGSANGRNPVWIVVPCHRIIAANGSLCGYGGGLTLKRALLDFEAGQRLFALAAPGP